MERVRVSDFSGGMNERVDPALLPASESVELKNSLTTRGRVVQRSGAVPLGGASGRPHGLALYSHPGGPMWFLGAWANALLGTTQPPSWVTLAPGSSLTDAIHTAVGTRDDKANWLAAVYSVSRPPSELLLVDLSSGAWTQPSLIAATAVASWQGRLWGGGWAHPSLAPDTLAWSRIWDGRDWSGILAQNIRVDPAVGGRLTAIVPARGAEPMLYLFKERSIYMMRVKWATDGWLPSTSDALDLSESLIENLSRRVGCVAGGTALWVPSLEGSDVFFLASDGIRSLRRSLDDEAVGGAGPPLTYDLERVMARVNWDAIEQAVATVEGTSYYAALPVDGAERPNLVLVKDLVQASPYRGWSVWDLPTVAIAADAVPGSRLYYQAATSATEAGYPSDTVHVYRVDETATVDPGGKDIEFSMTTRSFDLGDPGRRKLWRWFECYLAESCSGSTLSVDAYLDDDLESYTAVGATRTQPAQRTVRLPAMLPWNFSTEAGQVVKFGLEALGPSYRIGFRVRSRGGRVTMRHCEVAGQTVAKEWN